MPRSRRSNLPGGVFHLTARTQGHVHWLSAPIRSAAVESMHTFAHRAGSRLLAYAVMPNHLHIVLLQGEAPLWRTMQPILHRVALRVQRAHGICGHVFERRYWDRFCADAQYVRNSIVYTHLNPVRAGICTDPAEYEWTSHLAFVGQIDRGASGEALDLGTGLGVFGSSPGSSIPQLRVDYMEFVKWRMARDGAAAAQEDASTAEGPPTDGGDLCWSRTTDMRSSAARVVPHRGSGPQPPIETVALQVIGARGADLDLATVRSGERSRPVVRARTAIAKRLRAAGYRTSQIAAYLNVSDSTISNVLSGHRASGPR